MTRDEIIDRIRQNESRLKSRGVRHLALFGSRMRGDHRSDSDLDMLVDIDPAQAKFSLLDLAGVCSIVEDLTGIETIAIERPMLARQPEFARRIAPDVIEIF